MGAAGQAGGGGAGDGGARHAGARCGGGVGSIRGTDAAAQVVAAAGRWPFESRCRARLGQVVAVISRRRRSHM